MKTSWLLRVSDVSQYSSFQIYPLYVGVYRLRLLIKGIATTASSLRRREKSSRTVQASVYQILS
jgi:hypothetical protein